MIDEMSTVKLASEPSRPVSRVSRMTDGPAARNVARVVSAVVLFHWRYSVSHSA